MPEDNVNYQDLEHAVRMVLSGCATPEEASRISGIPLATIQTRIWALKAVGAPSCSSPTNTAVYKRSAKGVLTITRQSRNFPAVAKDIFFSIDGKATAADLASQSKATPAYVSATLKTWEREGYIEIMRRAAPTRDESTIDNASGETDLDFTQELARARTMLGSNTRELTTARTATGQDSRLEGKKEWLEIQTQPIRTVQMQAQENVRQINSQLDSERPSRQQILQALSEARTQVDKERSVAKAQAQTLARMRDELVAARHAHQAALAEQDARNKEQARLLAEADLARTALEADLIKARLERKYALRLLVQAR
jgi:hypothetical protein